MDSSNKHRPSDSASSTTTPPSEILKSPMDFLSRSWSAAALEVVEALSPPTATDRHGGGGGGGGATILEELAGGVGEEDLGVFTGNPITFACSATSQLVIERIMSQSEVLQLTTGRLSHSSGPLNGGSISDSPPVSPSDREDAKHCRATIPAKPAYKGGSRAMGSWLKDRREKRKEQTRALNAQLHAAVSVAGVAAAVAAVTAATAASSGKDDCASRTNLAIASAATLVAAQCVEAAEVLGAEREHLAAAVASAVNVRTPGDITTLTAAAATALRGAATLKARVLKEMWNIAAVIPVEKGFAANQNHHRHHSDGEARGSSGELIPGENFMGLCSQELLARGSELLKRTRKGDLHWKNVSVYIHRSGLVKLKMKSRHVAGAITKKKKNVVIGVSKDISAWPGRHLLDGGEERRYFGLKTAEQRVIEFECRGQREYEMWTKGVARLLAIVGDKARPGLC